ELELSSQEIIATDEKRYLSLFRLDFKAVVRYSDGSLRTVLIEMQKSKYSTDIQRFRTYLGQNYSKPEIVLNSEGKEEKTSYPIITIYILGYEIPEIEYMAVSINNHIIDSSTKEKLNIESDFINLLNHRSHVIQVARLPEHRKTKLEKMMMLFNQSLKTNDRFILDLEDVPEGFQEMVKYLQGPVNDEKFRDNLKAEEEIDDIFEEQERKALVKLNKAIEDKETALQEKDAALHSKDKAIEEKLNLRRKIVKTVQELNKLNMSIEQIVKIVGIDEDDIRSILKSN
ncbi:MAG: hypothetical protein GY777_31890, partial [Candidatus Brocadiaceae bacterium]|nr:hypothetical protein [Candidatus Brocadiaceae bacterium]